MTLILVTEITILLADLDHSWKFFLKPFSFNERDRIIEDAKSKRCLFAVRATNMEEIKDEVVIQTVKLPVKSAPSSRKYITILPAAQKPKISLVSSNKKSQRSISNNSDSDCSSGVTTVSPVAPKRRRVQMNGSRQVKFYPPLILTEEEKQLCQVTIICLL